MFALPGEVVERYRGTGTQREAGSIRAPNPHLTLAEWKNDRQGGQQKNKGNLKGHFQFDGY